MSAAHKRSLASKTLAVIAWLLVLIACTVVVCYRQAMCELTNERAESLAKFAVSTGLSIDPGARLRLDRAAAHTRFTISLPKAPA